jgi:hypothetical protein
MQNEVEAALKHAQEKLSGLLLERERIDRQIVDWNRVIESLSVVSERNELSVPPDLLLPAGLSAKPGLGFTDAVRVIVKNSEEGLSAREIRDELVRMGFDLSKYRQPMVPVHNTLRRLDEQQEIYACTDESGSGRVVYRRINPVARALALDPPPAGRRHLIPRPAGARARPSSTKSTAGSAKEG